MFPTHLKTKLRIATTMKLAMERQVFKLRNTERFLCEELYSVKSEIEQLTEQLEELKDKIYEVDYDLTRTEIQKSSERLKLESLTYVMINHKKSFDEMFEKERELLVLRNTVVRQREFEKEEQERQRQKKIQEQMEMRAKNITQMEEETADLEKECAVLKKRNNAIMIKLRRKLVETENIRKDLLKKCEASA